MFTPTESIVLRAAGLSALTSNTTLTHDRLSSDLSRYHHATVTLVTTDQSLGTASDEIDFYIQTTYDNGTTWTDLENIHFENGAAATNRDDGETGSWVSHIMRPTSRVAATAVTDGTLADDTVVDAGIGTGLRVKVVFTQTPSITCSIHVLLKGN